MYKPAKEHEKHYLWSIEANEKAIRRFIGYLARKYREYRQGGQVFIKRLWHLQGMANAVFVGSTLGRGNQAAFKAGVAKHNKLFSAR